MSTSETRTQPPASGWKETLHHQLFLTRDGLMAFAVLDGASVPGLLPRLRRDRPEHACLYRGALEPGLAEVAPYLVRLKPGTAFTQWVMNKGWANHWGIFALSRQNLATVRRHFRGFLMIKAPDGRQLYFRYYDPRVLPAFLAVADDHQVKRLFGPVDCYLCEGNGPDEMVLHRLAGNEFATERFNLANEPRDTLTRGSSIAVRELDAEGPARPEILMSIRPDQMDAMARPRREQLPRKIMRYLREQCPQIVQPMADEQLQAFVKGSVDRARSQGITIEWDLCRYCWLEALHGPTFTEDCGWARSILDLTDVTSTERVDMLEHYQRNYYEPMFNPR